MESERDAIARTEQLRVAQLQHAARQLDGSGVRIGELDERITLLNKTINERDAQLEELRSIQ
eukprot:6807805-Lingulodinium_polyedra.AAC.1